MTVTQYNNTETTETHATTRHCGWNDDGYTGLQRVNLLAAQVVIP